MIYTNPVVGYDRFLKMPEEGASSLLQREVRDTKIKSCLTSTARKICSMAPLLLLTGALFCSGLMSAAVLGTSFVLLELQDYLQAKKEKYDGEADLAAETLKQYEQLTEEQYTNFCNQLAIETDFAAEDVNPRPLIARIYAIGAIGNATLLSEMTQRRQDHTESFQAIASTFSGQERTRQEGDLIATIISEVLVKKTFPLFLDTYFCIQKLKNPLLQETTATKGRFFLKNSFCCRYGPYFLIEPHSYTFEQVFNYFQPHIMRGEGARFVDSLAQMFNPRGLQQEPEEEQEGVVRRAVIQLAEQA